MARKPGERYPSDAKRATRPSVRIHHSIIGHPRFAGAFADPEMRGMWVGLLVIASQRHASKTGDTVTLNSGDLTWLSGRAHRASAVRALRALCARFEYALEERDGIYRVQIRNFARKQGFTPQPHAGPRGAPTPSESDSESESESEVKNPPNPPRAGGTEPAGSARERPQVSGRMADVRRVWPRVAEAFASYPWGRAPQKLTATRERMMSARLREHAGEPPEILVEAVHGYVALHRAAFEQPGQWDPRSNFMPETVYRPSNFTKYLEAARVGPQDEDAERNRRNREWAERMRKEQLGR